MSPGIRMIVGGATACVAAALVAGCGGATVDGHAPEVSSDPTTSATSTSPFAEERPERPSGPVPPPPTPSAAPETMPGEPEPLPPPEDAPEPAPEPPPAEPAAPAPGAGDFVALLERRGVVLPEGVDPVATATEACGRFDGGQQMDEVSGWLGERARLDADGQGFFLGAAVGTYCPENFPKLG